MFSLAIIDLGIAASYLGWSVLARLGEPIGFGPFSVLSLDPANLLFLLAIGLVMFFRFTRVSDQQARAAAELDAAREIQQYLIPSSLPETPGLAIQSVYLPSREVGGDFFQILATPNGEVLIVIGDVSGKGMPAAMTVSLLVGTFRALANYTQSPGEILRAMNQRVTGRSHGGFTTCLVLRIDPDGAITAANAGHLPPYIDGEEINTENGLPLGLSAESTYSESTLTLAPGAQLTLLTDGIVEAQSATGELFGFDRTAAISTQSGEEIAAAAQAFGQEDDITVLTLTFSPDHVLLAETPLIRR
jgi:serine phosphatase RsbU (regulator of sigma subunit)